MRQCAAMGCRVLLLTLEKHRHADWPHDILAEVVYMPEGLNLEQVTNTVTYLGRSRKFERLVALDEFDMETIAHLREHMHIPGMGLTTTSHFRDKLAMRFEAQRAGAAAGAGSQILVPDFTPVLNYDDLRAYMASVPAPWVLKPRAEASAIGIRKIHEPGAAMALSRRTRRPPKLLPPRAIHPRRHLPRRLHHHRPRGHLHRRQQVRQTPDAGHARGRSLHHSRHRPRFD